MMRKILMLSTIACALALTGCANTKMRADKMPKGAVVNKQLTLPLQTSVAVYIPKFATDQRMYLETYRAWIEPGMGVKDGINDAVKLVFGQAKPFDKKSDEQVGLVLDFDPKWEFSSGKAKMLLSYKVFDHQQNIVAEGKTEHAADIGYIGNNAAFYNATLRATQLMLVSVANKLLPTPEKYPAAIAQNQIQSQLLANMEKPRSTGTGFYINDKGQMLTAAHVLQECMVIKGNHEGKEFDVTMDEQSFLLDLAVMSSNQSPTTFIPFRDGEKGYILGEMVTNVGYPLQGLLAASPNLTRGNISSKAGLKGSVGQFQFSAPIQPGSSGGPVVSDQGELLGVAVSTLNASYLLEKGILPQNVNFALDAKYITKYLDKHNVAYHKHQSTEAGSIHVANESALSNVIQLNCYQ